MRALILLALASFPYLLATTFTGLTAWDDEGYMMTIFQQIRNGAVPYSAVQSPYGPFYFVGFHVLFGWPWLPLTHDVVRLVSALGWLLHAFLFGLVLLRLTGSRLCAGAGLLAVVFLSREVLSSPLHPILLGLVLTAALFLLVDRHEAKPSRGLLVGMGALVAALGLMKINLGLITGGGLGLILLRGLPPSRPRNALQAIAMVALALLPIPLTQPLFDQGWPVAYAISACAVLTAAVLAWRHMPLAMRLAPADLGWVVAGGVLVLGLSVGLMLAAGTRPGDILYATLIYPTRWIREWFVIPPLDVFVLLWQVLSLAYAAARFGSAARAANRPLGITVALVLKGVVAAAGLVLTAVIAFDPDPAWPWPAYLFVGLCFIWLLGAPAGRTPSRAPALRAMLVLVGALFYLYPFPVAGGQLGTAVMFTSITCCVLSHDLWRELTARYPRAVPGIARPVARISAWAALLAVLATSTTVSWARYAEMTSPGLPGTRYVRAEAEVVETYRWLTRELADCPALFSFPGLPSLHFWTGHGVIPGATVNNYLALLSAPEQEALVARIEQVEDVCIVYSESLNIRQWDRGQMERNPPLLRYLRDNFLPAQERGEFQILRRRP